MNRRGVTLVEMLVGMVMTAFVGSMMVSLLHGASPRVFTPALEARSGQQAINQPYGRAAAFEL